MPKKEPKAKTTYAVHSANTGARICGPFANKLDAERECKRLNREAHTGRRADGGLINYRVIWRCPDCQREPERHPVTQGLWCGHGEVEPSTNPLTLFETGRFDDFVEADRVSEPIFHQGVQQSYEVQTVGGVVVG